MALTLHPSIHFCRAKTLRASGGKIPRIIERRPNRLLTPSLASFDGGPRLEWSENWGKRVRKEGEKKLLLCCILRYIFVLRQAQDERTKTLRTNGGECSE